MNTAGKIVIAVVAVLIVGLIIFSVWANCTESGIRTLEEYKSSLHKAYDDTSYETRKKVEDTCRAYMSQYKTDVDRYNLYKDNEDPEKQTWAEESYMRACETANTYNEYILKNSYVWKNNIPTDIAESLPIPVYTKPTEVDQSTQDDALFKTFCTLLENQHLVTGEKIPTDATMVGALKSCKYIDSNVEVFLFEADAPKSAELTVFGIQFTFDATCGRFAIVCKDAANKDEIIDFVSSLTIDFTVVNK